MCLGWTALAALAIFAVSPSVAIMRAMPPKEADANGASSVPALGSAKGVVSQFFHPKTGERVASLRIDSLRAGFDKEGLYRVPWRASCELADVCVEVSLPEAWESVAGQVREALMALGRARHVSLPRFRLVVGGTVPFSFEASEAEFAGDRILWSRQVEYRSGASVRRTRRVGLRLFYQMPGAWIEALPPQDIQGPNPDGRFPSSQVSFP